MTTDPASPSETSPPNPKRAKWWRAAKWYQLSAVPRGLLLAVVSASTVAALWWSTYAAHGCERVHQALSLGITPERVDSLTPASCALSETDLHSSLLIGLLAAPLYGFGLATVLLSFWRFGWRSRRQGAFNVARRAARVPLAAMAADFAENVVALLFVRVDRGRPTVGAWPASVLGTLGAVKWLLLAATGLVVFLTLYGAFRFRAIRVMEWSTTDQPSPSGPAPWTPTRPEIAVCLSGGGIRSAAFSWGALSRLEEGGSLGPATTIYSVSGGGYAALAATAASPVLRRTVGQPESGFYRLPQVGPDDPEFEPTTPYQHVRRHRRYLASLRGGVAWAVVKALMSVALNLTVVAAALVVLAIPVALVARSGVAVVANRSTAGPGAAGTLVSGAWHPVLWLVGVSVVLVAVAMGVRLARHAAVMKAAAIVGGLAVLYFVGAIGVPWLAHRLNQMWSVSWWATLPAVLTWTAGALFALLRARLSKAAVRLGGVLVVFGMVYTLLYVVRRAVSPAAKPGWNWLPDAWDPTWLWLLVFAGAGLVLVIIDFTGVQWWSMHPLYRDRLAGTFVLGQGDTGPVWRRHWRNWPRWSQTAPAPPAPTGPNHVVCAATHRRENVVTGTRTVSFRFSSEGVAFHNPHLDGDAIQVDSYRADATWLDRAFGVVGEGTENPRRHHVRATTVAAAAMSGAAFNPAMGRFSKGSTDSLLAVLNLRLGVWMPNPRFGMVEQGRRFPRPGLRYLFHEVIGHFDIDDPFVHVSDGGHWENLALTEALRDRPNKMVVVIDASGGRVAPPDEGVAGEGFGELRWASELARLELPAEVRLEVAEMRPLATTGRAPRSWQVGTVVFHSDREHNWSNNLECAGCTSVPLLYVKAVLCDRTGESVLAYANTDPTFPDYSTADQFLTEQQFEALARLGADSMSRALGANPIVGANAPD